MDLTGGVNVVLELGLKVLHSSGGVCPWYPGTRVPSASDGDSAVTRQQLASWPAFRRRLHHDHGRVSPRPAPCQ
eukprot:2898416-Rhodomonas_salina.1